MSCPAACRADCTPAEALPDAYRAWVWRGSAAPCGLVLETVARPALEAGQVLVRNAVIGLNPVDWKLLAGQFMSGRPGKVPGLDGAGTVVAVGEGVSADWLGRRVAYHQSLERPGSFAQYTPLAAEVLIRLPAALDFATAAAFPCPALTAWQALEKVSALPGDELLISGAGGSVGHYLVQLAAARGFVVSVMCHARHRERLYALGASEWLGGPLAESENWADWGPARFHAVIDCVSAAHAERLAPAVLANGHLVCIQGRVARWPDAPFGRALSLHEVALGALHRFGDRAAWQRLTDAGEALLRALAEGRLQAEAALVGEFAELPQRLLALQHRQFSGKALIRV
ncbi:zinc-binding dehydrogenase [Pseudomonas sp. GCM10022188]|uniref:zinc-binding dehydrogenase n=1 Tax=Pseudomonas TaxID=286 RepID=UPI001E2CB424|nr:zinc-binding dehydrogenase [Pseudomonas oryzagri]MCC6076536.1 zinc-binding dehydrogenase [Pseudomonas oryzagri]